MDVEDEAGNTGTRSLHVRYTLVTLVCKERHTKSRRFFTSSQDGRPDMRGACQPGLNAAKSSNMTIIQAVMGHEELLNKLQ